MLVKYNDLPDELELLSKEVVDCFFQVHKEIGPGYTESIYHDCLCIELDSRNIKYNKEFPVHIVYKNQKIPSEYRLDLLVEDQIVIELKAIEKLAPVHQAQLYAYLKATKLPMGFLVNFNSSLIKDGIKRFVPKKSS